MNKPALTLSVIMPTAVSIRLKQPKNYSNALFVFLVTTESGERRFYASTYTEGINGPTALEQHIRDTHGGEQTISGGALLAINCEEGERPHITWRSRLVNYPELSAHEIALLRASLEEAQFAIGGWPMRPPIG
jgi:hypothetical protein